VNRIFKIAGISACVLTVLVMSGGHWLALQSFAWMHMTVEFSREYGWRTAIQRTFSGRHPCKLCLKVQQGWQQERQQDKKSPRLEAHNFPEVIWEWRALTAPPAPTCAGPEGVFASGSYSDFSESPPTPPPRA